MIIPSKSSKKFQLEQKDLRVTIIQNLEPLGLQRLANTILAKVTSKYIMRLDADDMLIETSLLSLVEKAKLAKNGDNAFVTGDYFVSDHLGKITGHQSHKEEDEGVDLFNELAPHRCMHLAAVRLIKAIGGYSTEFRAQDGWDIWTKIQNRCEHLHVNSPIFIYRQHHSSMSQKGKDSEERRKIIASRSSIKREQLCAVTRFLIAAKSIYPIQQGIPLITLAKKHLYKGV